MLPINPDCKNREEMLKYLSETATANCEADVEKFLGIFDPVEDRSEMQDIFKENLGYDPITYYDVDKINSILDGILESVGKKKLTILEDHKEDILKRAHEIYEELRVSNLRRALDMAIQEYIPDWKVSKAAIVEPERPEPIEEPDDEADIDATPDGADPIDDDMEVDEEDSDLKYDENDEDEPFDDIDNIDIPELDDNGDDDEVVIEKEEEDEYEEE